MEPPTPDDTSWLLTQQVIERELATIRGAIEMVADGSSSRIVLGGLRFAEEILPQARAFAAEVGVRIVPLWMADDAGTDLAIERMDD
ncbi:MAG TPA: hypothetical protein VIK13_15655 [Candidatus Limnocylindrales bacterium]